MTDQHRESIFTPECLSINLGNACNLSCKYCFARDSKNFQPAIHKKGMSIVIKAIHAGASFVAEQCLADKRPFFFGFQGDGEPLIQFDLLQRLYTVCLTVCKKYNLPYFAFITSNGTLADDKYQWLTRAFNRVCISMDGPPRIQNHNRPSQDGQPTHHRVKQTLDILRAGKCTPVCRTTVTAKNVETLPETVRYLCQEMGFKDIQLEPVYRFNMATQDVFPAEMFADKLIISKMIADEQGCKISYSGYRKESPHGPYCNVLKKVLHISPKGKADVCTFGCAPDEYATIGRYDPDSERVILDHKRIDIIIRKLDDISGYCKKCPINRHCVRGCPDICVLEESKKSGSRFPIDMTETLRCQINRRLYQKGW